MSLINKNEIAKSIKCSFFLCKYLSDTIYRVLKLNKVNIIYDKYVDKSPLEFVNSIIYELNISIEIEGTKNLENLPKDKAFITISNHPYGGIDGIILLKVFLESRSDFKVMANYLLQKVKPLNEVIIPVNPFNEKVSVKSSLTGMRETLNHLNNNYSIGIFPAGEVSALNNKFVVTDKDWELSAIKLIKKANVTILPVYFYGRNSMLFYLLGKINPIFRTARLPLELLNKRNKSIKLKIGKPIMSNEQNNILQINEFEKYLRETTFNLN